MHQRKRVKTDNKLSNLAKDNSLDVMTRFRKSYDTRRMQQGISSTPNQRQLRTPKQRVSVALITSDVVKNVPSRFRNKKNIPHVIAKKNSKNVFMHGIKLYSSPSPHISHSHEYKSSDLESVYVSDSDEISAQLTTFSSSRTRKMGQLRSQRNQFVKRINYTRSEDQAILDYLLNHNLISKVNLRSTWNELYENHVTEHTSESMRNRMRTSIVNRLQELLPNHNKDDISKIKQELLVSADSSTENSKFIPTPNLVVTKPAVSEEIMESSILTSDNSMNTSNNDVSKGSIHNEQNILNCQNNADSADKSVSLPFQVPNVATGYFELVDQEISLPTKSKLTENQINDRYACLLPQLCEPVMESNTPSIVRCTASSVNVINTLCEEISFAEACLFLHLTSGSIEDARHLMNTGVRQPLSITSDFTPPIWMPEDDAGLLSIDIVNINAVVKKFGLTDCSHRLLYLTDQFF